MTTDVKKHWFDGASGDLLRRIDQALVADGKDPAALTLDELSAVDEFHIRGREATVEMSQLARIQAHERVLDVGSGIGGPARFLASTCGCTVTGIDLTEEYCDVANALAARVGLDGQVTHRPADALDLPFEDDAFDVAWTQHISMNIADKRAFFSEMARVVRPGGRLVVYDPVLGDGGPLHFPVPWSRDGAISFLVPLDETRDLLETLGLRITEWHDATERLIAWFQRNAGSAARPSALGLGVLLGDVWPEMARNMVQNLTEGRIRVLQAVAHVPD